MPGLGLSSYALPWTIGSQPDYTPFDLLAEARRLGLSGLQLCDNLPLTALTAGPLRRFAAQAREAGLTVEVGMRGLLLPEVRQHLELCRTLDARLLRIVIDRGGFEPTAGECTRLLSELVPELEASGVVLGVENHDRFRARDLARLVQDVGSPHIGFCLDTANSLGAGEGLGEILPALAPRTVNLHLKDFTVRRLSHQLGFVVEGAPAGAGMVDWNSLLDALPPDITLALEQWPPEQETLEATVQLEQAWLEQSVTYLRDLLVRRMERSPTGTASA